MDSSPTRTDGMTTRAVIFDLDGTVTEPYLDFALIREEIGLRPEAGPILEAMDRMTEGPRRRAEAILLRHEAEAAEVSILNDGARDLLQWLHRNAIQTAILTRNSRESARKVLTRHALRFDVVRTREDGSFKPSPEPVWAICRQLGVQPRDSWVVGDYLFDVQSGRAAGTRTALLWTPPELPPWHPEADHVIRHLSELIPLIRKL
jgi:HAD superfamily hydrolase (TIGR01509 family)